MSLHDITRESVLRAVKEFDDLKRDEFLKRYNFGKAKGYYLVWNGKKYDSKAIVGVAHKFLSPESNALSSDEFYGGKRAAVEKLLSLGFDVLEPSDSVSGAIPFKIGQTYSRQQDIHEVFGGQERQGIVTPDNVPFIFLFTGETGEQYGYVDGWKSEGLFAYTGEGQSGDMTFIRGNKAIRDHRDNGKELLLFEATKRKGIHRFVGVFNCAGWELGTSPDKSGAIRSSIIFHLVSTSGSAPFVDDEDADAALEETSLEELRQIAIESSDSAPTSKGTSTRNYYKRSKAVAAFVLRRANGTCEACDKSAPFLRMNGEPYLEPHHIMRIADGGPDHPDHVGAICPSCHREIHHGKDGKALNEKLLERVTVKARTFVNKG